MEKKEINVHQSELQPSNNLRSILSVTPEIKKRNRNSKASNKKKTNRNSKPSKKRKTNRNSKPSKINKSNRYTKPSAEKRYKHKADKSDQVNNVSVTESNSINMGSSTEEELQCSEVYQFLNDRFFSNNIFGY